MKTEKAEAIRKRYQYRRLVLRGQADLPHQTAVRLIGPDCAYHLYTRNARSTSYQRG